VAAVAASGDRCGGGSSEHRWRKRAEIKSEKIYCLMAKERIVDSGEWE